MNIDFKTYHQFDNKFDGKKKCPHECYSSGICPFNISEEKIPCAEEYPYADCYYNFSSAGQYVVFDNVFDNIQVMKVNDNEATTVSTQIKYKLNVTEPGEYRIRWYTKSNIISDSNAWAFYYVENLTSIDLTRLKIKSLPGQTFTHNSSLTAITGLEGIEYFPKSSISTCPKLQVIPSLINAKQFGDYAFANNNSLKEIIIGPKCEYIGYQCFTGNINGRTYIFQGKTPPAVNGTNGNQFQFNVSPTIYVPVESLNLYKTATGWSAWASRIFPMSI